MKSSLQLFKGLKTGTVTLAEARRAAREAKKSRPSGSSTSQRDAIESSLRERYLGHFGTVPKSAKPKTSIAKRSSSPAKRGKPVSPRRRSA